MDSDDDDEEFELADKEENEDRLTIMNKFKNRPLNTRGSHSATRNGFVFKIPKQYSQRSNTIQDALAKSNSGNDPREVVF